MTARLAPDAMYPAGAPGVETRFVTLPSCVRLRVAQSGPQSGEPVILLHGWAASAYTYRFLVAALAESGYRAYAVDFRGHGLSDKPSGPGAYTREALVGDILQLMDVLGLEEATFVGWSMGGAVALRMATEHRERVSRLVLINPAGLGRIGVLRAAALLSPGCLDLLAPWLVPRRLVDQVLRWASGDPDFVTEQVVDEYWAPSRDRGYARAMRALLRDFDWSAATPDELATIRVPTLLVVSGADRVIQGVAAAVRHIPGGCVVQLPGAGHMAHENHFRDVNRVVLKFLARSSSRLSGTDNT